MYGIHRLIVAALALLVVATSTTAAIAAGPRVILVYGPPLAKPIVLYNWAENEQLMGAAADAATIKPAELKGRPYLNMALFWGSGWGQYVKHSKPLGVLRPDHANQCVRFYPAYGAASPLMVFDSILGPYTSLTHVVRPEGIAILARHGVPVRLKVGTKPFPASRVHCTGTME